MSSYIGVPYAQDVDLSAVKSRLATAENTIVANKNTYDTKVASIDSTTANHETRLTTAESDIATIQTQITVELPNSVNQIVTTRMAQETFDHLKQELANTESELSAALATKVAETVQIQTDAAQDALIASKVAQVAYDTDKAAQGVINTGFNTKILAIEEFVNVFLAANVLKYDNNTLTYSYTGVSQGISLTAPAPAPAP